MERTQYKEAAEYEKRGAAYEYTASDGEQRGGLVIATKHLTKAYGRQKVVSEVDLHVKKGRIYGLPVRIPPWWDPTGRVRPRL